MFLKTFVFGGSKKRGIKSHTAQLEEAKQELSVFFQLKNKELDF